MDMFTLHVEHAVLLGLFTILTLINCRLHDGAKDTYWFPAYTLCAFLGALLVALRAHGVSEVIAVVVGTTFFHLAYLCLHRGLNGLYERKDSARWPMLGQFAAVLIAVIGLIQFGFVHPNTARRIVFYSFVFSFQTALIAVVSLRYARGFLRWPGRLMSGLLALLTLNNLIRAAITLHSGAPDVYVQGGFPLQMSVLETTVLQSGITVAFVWMTAAVLHDKLDRLASTDSLTGLLNRRAVEVAARREIAMSRKSKRPLTAILIDLDHFKRINDSFGHSFGDRALLEVSRCLQEHMRQSDLLARVGGDEFAVMLHNTSSEEAMEIAERLRASLEALVVVDGEVEARVSASLGLAEVDDSTGDWNELVVKCDKAVYAVKEIGGNLAVSN
jgi:diguanylate cyclase (GGDEF)-like protein